MALAAPGVQVEYHQEAQRIIDNLVEPATQCQPEPGMGLTEFVFEEQEYPQRPLYLRLMQMDVISI